jgi:hypothetical protein
MLQTKCFIKKPSVRFGVGWGDESQFQGTGKFLKLTWYRWADYWMITICCFLSLFSAGFSIWLLQTHHKMELWLMLNIITMITSYFLSVLWYFCLWPQVTTFKVLVFVITSCFLSVCVICDHKLLPVLLFVITGYFLSVLWCFYLWPQVTYCKALLFVITSNFLYCYLWSQVTFFLFVITSYFLSLFVICDNRLLPFTVRYLRSQVTSLLFVTTSYFLYCY